MKNSKVDGLDLNQYTKTFTSFSGADMIMSFDGKVIGELQAVKWEKTLDAFAGGGVKGTIHCPVSDSDPILDFEGKKFDILIRFMNEYGQSKIEFIKGVRLKTKQGGASVDDCYQQSGYTFEAQDAIVIADGMKTAQENMSFIFNNYNTQESDVRMEVEAYLALMKLSFEIRHFEIINSGELARLRRADKELNSK